jgi:hypothetical protein
MRERQSSQSFRPSHPASPSLGGSRFDFDFVGMYDNLSAQARFSLQDPVNQVNSLVRLLALVAVRDLLGVKLQAGGW